MNDPTITQSPAAVSYFDRLHELFDRVIDLPPAHREAALARVPPELAADLRALLEHAGRSDTPLDSAAVRLPADEPPLPRIAGFRVHRCIGRGGSATVYLADQEHADFTRRVALKVVDRPFDAGSLRSLREEQRILARLEHPGIARLYDSGAMAAGQHWLAMEYVEGESILEHCNARELPPRERIELFLQVLDAVAYAHTCGIVHRDLKPANIFVTANGEARLLDFGIAKLTDPTDEDETRTLRRALTPAYASPEQMRGGRTTAASDIYSLAVVLYELLTGALPGDDTEQRRLAGGDVDAVLNKALRQRPERRYASVAAFADDLRNVLAGAPVAARRGERGYRIRKFLRRQRWAVAAAVTLAVFVAGWQIVDRWRATRPGSEVAIYHTAERVDFETRRLLRDGAAKLVRFDGFGARESFREATESSKGRMPGEALAWDGLSRAESSLGETGRAAEAARRAGALIAGHPDALPQHEAERLRARSLAANRDWSAAIAAFDALFGAHPERLDLGLDLVATLLAAGRTDAADTAYGRLRQLGLKDPRIDLIEAEVALPLSEFQRAAAAATRARDGAASVQAIALGQRAARLRADAMGRLARNEEARRELESIIARNVALGLAGEAAQARLAYAQVLLQWKGPAETRGALEAAAAGCAQTGNRRCELTARVLVAMMTAMDGKLTDAIRTARTTVDEARATGDRWCEGYVLSQLHVLYNWADDQVSLKAMEEPLLSALRDSGNRRLLAVTLTNLSVVETEALNLEKAEAYIVEASTLARRIGSSLTSASVDAARGYLEQTRGDLDLARKSYTDGLLKARQSGVSWNVGSYHNDLAWLEVDAGRPGPAAEHARESMKAFTAVGDHQMAARSEGALAWSEARQGNTEAAWRRVEMLRKTMVDGEANAFTFLDIEAHVAAAARDWRRAIEIRRRTLRMAAGFDAAGVVIRERVHLATALHGAGERRALESLVAELLPEVERHGLRGVARELRALVAR